MSGTLEDVSSREFKEPLYSLALYSLPWSLALLLMGPSSGRHFFPLQKSLARLLEIVGQCLLLKDEQEVTAGFMPKVILECAIFHFLVWGLSPLH